MNKAADSIVKHCTLEDIGLVITGADAQPVVDAINKYLHEFAAPLDGKCHNCGAKLSGLFGSFVFGLAYGEGHCGGSPFSDGECGWPCRAIHNITNSDGAAVFERPLRIPLAYHSDFVAKREA